jgi:hypothetical protein
VIYIVFVAAIGLIGLLLFTISLTRGGAGGVFAGLIVILLLKLFYIIGARLTLDLIAVIFRIGEDTSRIAESIGVLCKLVHRRPAAGSLTASPIPV